MLCIISFLCCSESDAAATTAKPDVEVL